MAGYVSEALAEFCDGMAWRMKAAPDLSYEARLRQHREDEVVAAVLATGRRWAVYGVSLRSLNNREFVDENDRVTADLGITPATWSGLRSLAGHKGLGMETVVRAALQGRLADLVGMPEVR